MAGFIREFIVISWIPAKSLRDDGMLYVIPEVVFGDPCRCLSTRCVLDFRQKDHGNDEIVDSHQKLAG
jgi:hypothetical protein